MRLRLPTIRINPMLRTLLLGTAGLMIAAFLLMNPPVGAQEARGLRTIANRVKPLHKPKEKPLDGDWLASHDEKGQTFRQYLRSNPNRPTNSRHTIYIQPIGKFDEQEMRAVRDTTDFIHRFYGLKVTTLKTLGADVIPEKARRVHPSWGDKQWLTSHILYEVLKPKRPADAVAVLALTAHDLWPGENWNFVFGQADLRQRVGVWSMYRNGKHSTAKEYRTFLRRTLKTAVHELGHMFSIQHCIAYQCCMNGSNNRSESDRQPLTFCPECVQKIWYACQVDPHERYQRLHEFAKVREMKEEAEDWKQAAERVPKSRSRNR